MNLSLNSLRAPRAVSFAVSFIFIAAVVVLMNFPAQTKEKQGSELPAGSRVQQAKRNAAITERVKPVPAAAGGSSAVLLKLAASVGQSVPAQRLAEVRQRAGSGKDSRYFVVVDFNQHSSSKRMYVFDTQLQTVDRYYVSHGRGSEGAKDDGIADVFSNQDSSFSSSLGIYRTIDDYVGKHGRSMRLEGLEATNSNARDRAIVLHRADYVSENVIKSTGRLGRSQGCFAVENAVADTLIDKLQGGAYVIAWKS
jgi:hypothetical protein